jgi:hypothetical protein
VLHPLIGALAERRGAHDGKEFDAARPNCVQALTQYMASMLSAASVNPSELAGPIAIQADVRVWDQGAECLLSVEFFFLTRKS